MNTPAALETTSMERSEILGVLHLKRFWMRRMSAFSGAPVPPVENEEILDNVLLNGLGLAWEETASFFVGKPAFGEFEIRIIEKNGGSIDQLVIERINCVVSGEPYNAELRAYVSEIEEVGSVLTPDDLAFWEENGYVIVRGAISAKDTRKAEDAVWDHLEMSREEPTSWYQKPIGKGIMTQLYHHPALAANRASLRVRKAFSQLWQTGDLWTTTDRAGFNPPETSTFRFPGPNLHWDMSLVAPFNFGTQGILYLCDTAKEQGAFTCIPGFHKKIEAWLESLPAGTDPRKEICRYPAEAIAGNAGDLVIWHYCLPHGSRPNRGVYPRIVQYINMYPAAFKKKKAWR